MNDVTLGVPALSEPSRAQASPEAPAGLRPTGFDPARVEMVADIIAQHVDPRPHGAPDDWNDGSHEAARAILSSLPACHQCAVYRDIFAEITAKAQPYCGDPSDPERIRGYRIPCGPIHRAAGDLSFQMFDGEATLRRLIDQRSEMLQVLLQYESDLLRPPEGDSRERRLERVRQVIATLTQGE